MGRRGLEEKNNRTTDTKVDGGLAGRAVRRRVEEDGPGGLDGIGSESRPGDRR